MATSYFEKPAFSPEAGVITTRPSSTALLTIDSEDRYQAGYPQSRASQTPNESGTISVLANASPYDFTITKNESIMNGFFTRLGLTEVSFDWAIPNINPKTNRIYVSWSNLTTNVSGQALVGLFNGAGTFATPFEIAAEVKSNVQAANVNLSGFDMTYGQGYGASGYPQFYYDSGASNVSVSFQPLVYNNANWSNANYYPYPETTKQLFDLLGLTNANTTFSSTVGNGPGQAGQTYSSTATYCQATQYIDIVCSQLTYNQPLKDTMSQPIARDSLCRLYLGDMNGFTANNLKCNDSNFCPPGCRAGTIYRQFQTPKMINWLSAGKAYQPVPGSLRFQVYDDAGALLTEMCGETNLSGGIINSQLTLTDFLNWRATLLVSEN